MPLKRLLFGALLVLACAGATRASAQTSPSDGEARSLYEAGAVAFSDTRYEQALARFEEAYALSRRPALLYNIGLTHDRLGHDGPALTAFRGYLDALPDAENRPEVERRIAVLTVRVSGAPSVPVAASAADAASDPGPWVLVGGGAALAIAGAVLLGVGAADVASVQGSPDGTPWRDVAGAAERGTLFEGTS